MEAVEGAAMNFDQLVSDVGGDEGFSGNMYYDSKGFATVGFGFCIDKRVAGATLSMADCNIILQNKLQKVIGTLDYSFPWYRTLSDARQRALANMCYQMGIDHLRGFTAMLEAFANGNYADAAAACLDSEYAKDAPARAGRVAELIKNG